MEPVPATRAEIAWRLAASSGAEPFTRSYASWTACRYMSAAGASAEAGRTVKAAQVSAVALSARAQKKVRIFSGFSRCGQRRADSLRLLEQVEAFFAHAEVEVDKDDGDLEHGKDE